MSTIDYISQLEKLNDDNWSFIASYMEKLVKVVGKNPKGSSRKILDYSELIYPLGYRLTDAEHNSFLAIINSSYGEFLYGTFRVRATFYLTRLLRALERFPYGKFEKIQIFEWFNCVNGLLRDMDAIIHSSEILKEVEHFASSTLSLTRFLTTWHDPELVTALYLLELSEREGRGTTYSTERYLVERAKHELEVLIDPSTKALYTELLDDEANIWWGLFKLLHWELDKFELHTYRGVSGFISILERVIERKSITYPKGDLAKRELTFEVQGEYKTILNITSTAFMLADMLQDIRFLEQSQRVRAYAVNLITPYVLGEKTIDRTHLYFRALESEVWGRIITWHNDGSMMDFRGQKISPGYYRKALLKHQ